MPEVASPIPRHKSWVKRGGFVSVLVNPIGACSFHLSASFSLFVFCSANFCGSSRKMKAKAQMHRSSWGEDSLLGFDGTATF